MQHAPISRARYVQENRKVRIQDACEGWSDDVQLAPAHQTLIAEGRNP